MKQKACYRCGGNLRGSKGGLLCWICEIFMALYGGSLNNGWFRNN